MASASASAASLRALRIAKYLHVRHQHTRHRRNNARHGVRRRRTHGINHIKSGKHRGAPTRTAAHSAVQNLCASKASAGAASAYRCHASREHAHAVISAAANVAKRKKKKKNLFCEAASKRLKAGRLRASGENSENPKTRLAPQAAAAATRDILRITHWRHREDKESARAHTAREISSRHARHGAWRRTKLIITAAMHHSASSYVTNICGETAHAILHSVGGRRSYIIERRASRGYRRARHRYASAAHPRRRRRAY